MPDTIPPTDKSQYNILLKAFDDQRTLLIRCKDRRTKKMVTLLAAYHVDESDGAYSIFPMARILSPEEFEHYEPPAPSDDDRKA